jgi:hypothetical protein
MGGGETPPNLPPPPDFFAFQALISSYEKYVKLAPSRFVKKMDEIPKLVSIHIRLDPSLFGWQKMSSLGSLLVYGPLP